MAKQQKPIDPIINDCDKQEVCANCQFWDWRAIKLNDLKKGEFKCNNPASQYHRKKKVKCDTCPQFTNIDFDAIIQDFKDNNEGWMDQTNIDQVEVPPVGRKIGGVTYYPPTSNQGQ